MRRDKTLIRTILERLAQQDSPWMERDRVLDGLGEQVDALNYHVSLCEQAGYVVVRRRTGEAQQLQLTWEGHEVLEQQGLI